MSTKKIVHIGLGAFFKAHQAWYTFKSDVGKNWEIIAFTGRSPDAAIELSENGFQYNLVIRGAQSDVTEVIDVVKAAYPISDTAALNRYLADESVAIVTLTITESAYHLNTESPITKLFTGLKQRFEGGAKPIAIVPCDNLMQNGALVRSLLSKLAVAESAEFQRYLAEQVSVVSTSVDRITPKSELKHTVITEPYSAWILQGEFPLGRPNWELAGAQFVTEVAPFEKRKLWLLNGAHSYLAYAGLAKGYQTVAQAISDPEIRKAVSSLWREASECLPNPELKLDSYQADLIARFSNARIEHKLSQIAIDGSLKLRERIVPVLINQLKAGRSFQATASVVAKWIEFISTNEFTDANQTRLMELSGECGALLKFLNPELGENKEVLDLIESMVEADKRDKYVKTASK